MKKLTHKRSIGIALIAMLTFFSSGALASAATTANDGTHVMIMTHLCDSSIKTVQDFETMENGKSPVANLGNDVLHCPTTGLMKDPATPGTVASPRTTYDFSVQTGSAAAQTLQQNGQYEQMKACESDLNVDVNGDGKVSSSTCLDTSHYKMHIPDGGSSFVNVTETQAPAGFHFGILRFTPVAVDGNNDSETLSSIDSANGRIDVNATPDKDGMIMLHIYQFMNSGSSSTNPPTSVTSCMIRGNLMIGSRGVDVPCLQGYLMAKGYLAGNLPLGYFGILTKQGLMRWQAAAGISATGFFGPISMAAFNAR